jgi:hypothetical protein
MVFAVEAWTIPDSEEPCEEDMEESEEFESDEAARLWVWDRLEEGFQVRMYRR